MAVGKPVELHYFARAELQHSVLFYRERGGDELANRFKAAVETTLQTIAADPARFLRVRKFPLVQKCRLTRFPFSLYYIERPADIWVIAVAHSRRRPGYWLARLKE